MKLTDREQELYGLMQRGGTFHADNRYEVRVCNSLVQKGLAHEVGKRDFQATDAPQSIHREQVKKPRTRTPKVFKADVEGYAEAWLDTKKLHGVRRLVLFNGTKKYVRVLDVASLRTQRLRRFTRTVGKKEYPGLQDKPRYTELDADWNTVALIIEARQKELEKINRRAISEGRAPVSYARKATEAIIRACRNKAKTSSKSS